MLIQSTRNHGSQSIKALIYGSPGVGKTTLAGTTGEPTLVISFEGGLLSLNDKDVDFVDCTLNEKGEVISKSDRLAKLAQVYQWVQTSEVKSKYKWLFIDSLTEIGQNVIEKQNLLFPERKDALPMWGEVSKELRGIIKAFRDLPYYNVVFTALSEVDKDEMGSRFHNVALPGKTAQQAPAYFDLCLYYHVYQDDKGEKQRGLVTQPSDKAVAKDRSGKLDLLMEPNLEVISRRIRGS